MFVEPGIIEKTLKKVRVLSGSEKHDIHRYGMLLAVVGWELMQLRKMRQACNAPQPLAALTSPEFRKIAAIAILSREHALLVAVSAKPTFTGAVPN